MFGRLRRPHLYLFMYDMRFADVHNAQHQDVIAQGCRPMYMAAKYALHVTDRNEDAGLMAQRPVTCDEGMNEVVWFSDKKDLPVAIAQLREKYPDVEVPDQVDFEVDWPFDRNNFDIAGSSIVVPVAPALVARAG